MNIHTSNLNMMTLKRRAILVRAGWLRLRVVICGGVGGGMLFK